jgi:hypothetical protein
MNEIWKDVIGYEGIYQVSSLGRVKSLKFDKEKILKPSLNSRGYKHVSLSSNNNKRTKKVHVLVSETFLNHKTCGMLLVIDHINDNPLDNRLENLQIVTTRFNTCKTQGKYSSQYKGVSWCKRDKVWKSSIRINGILVHLGRFKNEYDAHIAYQNKLLTLNK